MKCKKARQTTLKIMIGLKLNSSHLKVRITGKMGENSKEK